MKREPNMKEPDQKMIITGIFDASRDLVWKAWINPDLVKEWWGPKDFTAPMIQIDFREGGKYLYCMHGPKGTEFDKDFWNAGIFKEIVPMKKIVSTDFFSDEKGNKVDPIVYGMDPKYPKEVEVIVTFDDVLGDQTKLTITYPRPKLDAAFDAMKNSGMETGWNQSFDKLEKTLSSSEIMCKTVCERR